MFRRMLLPLTGSTPGLRATEQAIELAAARQLQLIGVKVAAPLPLPPMEFVPTGGYLSPEAVEVEVDAYRQQEQSDEQLLQDFRARCTKRRVICCTHREAGPVATDVLRYAPQADLLWLSRAGLHAGHTTWFSTFEDLLRHSPLPVWVVHEQATLPQRLVVAYHGDERSNEALVVSAGLARAWELPLTLLVIHEVHLAGIPEPSLTHAEAFLRQFGHAADSVEMSTGLADELLPQFTAPDHLLVMGTHAHGPFLGFRRGHTVDQVLLHAQGSVLLCPRFPGQS